MPAVVRDLTRSLLALAALSVICGVAYPVAAWAIGQAGFSHRANGSLVRAGGRVVGSSLQGQEWKGARWFHGRPSAVGYDAASSGASNLGPNSRALSESVAERLAATAKKNGVPAARVPVDLVTASASGLDPDISLDGALIQARRVARARGLPPARVQRLVRNQVHDRTLGFLGSRRVNVLRLNIALAELRAP